MYHTGERWNPYDSDAQLDEMLNTQRGITNREERETLLQFIARYTKERALGRFLCIAKMRCTAWVGGDEL